jgi:hypothetical protein
MAVGSARLGHAAVAFTRRTRALADAAFAAGGAVLAATVAGPWDLRESFRPEHPDRTLEVSNTGSRHSASA